MIPYLTAKNRMEFEEGYLQPNIELHISSDYNICLIVLLSIKTIFIVRIKAEGSILKLYIL